MPHLSSGLEAIEDAPHAVTFGAMVSHRSATPHLAAIAPDLGELMRVAGKTLRTTGTIGNISDGSPTGDISPALLALGATLSLQRGDVQRNVTLEDYFIACRKQDRAAGEFVRSMRVPKLESNERFRCYKTSKSLNQEISGAMGAFKFTLAKSSIQAARIVFGGIADTPKRASHAELALAGANLANEMTWRPALLALENDVAGIDGRASACARDVARALLYKALIEVARSR